MSSTCCGDGACVEYRSTAFAPAAVSHVLRPKSLARYNDVRMVARTRRKFTPTRGSSISRLSTPQPIVPRLLVPLRCWIEETGSRAQMGADGGFVQVDA